MKFSARHILFTFWLLSCASLALDLSAQAQYADFKGSIYDAQAGAAVLTTSPLAIYTNPADLIFTPGFAISASAKNYFFGEDDIWSGILASSFALSKKDALGIALSTIGNSAAGYLSLSAAYAHKLREDMGLGVSFNAHRYNVSHYRSRWLGSVDIGFRAAVYPQFHIEVSVHNPYEIGDIDYIQSHTSIIVQVLYELTDQLHWTTAFKKNWNAPMSFHTALSFLFMKNLKIYAGAGVSPAQFGLGLSYNIGNFNLMTASRYRTPLGFSPSIQMEYKSE